MVRLDCLIFGYRKIRINPSDLSFVTSHLIRSSIPTRINNDGTITVREKDFANFQDIFEGRIEYSASELLGFYGWIKALKHKKAIAFAIMLSIVICAFFSGLVWDIRVIGNENIPSSKIVYHLSRCGFKIGDFWALSDRSSVEANMLLEMDELAWININRRGTVAYINVIEKKKDYVTDESSREGYANIVSAVDCIIEEITVVSGTAAVKVGDVVKKGDLLISGIVSSETGGVFCHAEGRVIGRISDSIIAEVDREHTVLYPKERKICSIAVKIFNFSINIFKLYGNMTKECDIIETEKAYSLFGKCKLPLSVMLEYLPVYETKAESYTDEEIVLVTSSRLNSMIASRLATSDLVGIKTYGKFTDTGYEMRSDIIFVAEVGETVEFSVD